MTDDMAARYEADADEADALEFGSGTPVDVKAGPQRMSAFAVRFDPADVDRLRARAHAEGIGVTQLVREWILERLERERRRPGTADAGVWDRTRAAVEELLPEIVARVSSGPTVD